jgi:hypothetical protein
MGRRSQFGGLIALPNIRQEARVVVNAVPAQSVPVRYSNKYDQKQSEFLSSGKNVLAQNKVFHDLINQQISCSCALEGALAEATRGGGRQALYSGSNFGKRHGTILNGSLWSVHTSLEAVKKQ